MFWSFAICAFFCEFGEMVTTASNAYDADVYCCGWYLLPIKMQKMYLIFKSNTQHPMIIRGYANIKCTREIFKEVNLPSKNQMMKASLNESSLQISPFQTTNKGFSYFMMARQIFFKNSWMKNKRFGNLDA